MKRTVLFAVIAIAALMVACGNPSHVSSTSTCDSCQVESAEVDTLAIEAIELDSISNDTISE